MRSKQTVLFWGGHPPIIERWPRKCSLACSSCGISRRSPVDAEAPPACGLTLRVCKQGSCQEQLLSTGAIQRRNGPSGGQKGPGLHRGMQVRFDPHPCTAVSSHLLVPRCPCEREAAEKTHTPVFPTRKGINEIHMDLSFRGFTKSLTCSLQIRTACGWGAVWKSRMAGVPVGLSARRPLHPRQGPRHYGREPPPLNWQLCVQGIQQGGSPLLFQEGFCVAPFGGMIWWAES